MITPISFLLLWFKRRRGSTTRPTFRIFEVSRSALRATEMRHGRSWRKRFRSIPKADGSSRSATSSQASSLPPGTGRPQKS